MIIPVEVTTSVHLGSRQDVLDLSIQLAESARDYLEQQDQPTAERDARFEATLGKLIGRFVLARRNLKAFLDEHEEFRSALTNLHLEAQNPVSR